MGVTPFTDTGLLWNSKHANTGLKLLPHPTAPGASTLFWATVRECHLTDGIDAAGFESPVGVASPGVGSLIDKLLGRTKKDPSPPPTPPPPTPPPTPQLASIAVADPSTLPPGAMAVVGATVNLTAAASVDTTVQAASTNPAALTVESVTVPVGHSSAPLLVNVLEGGASVQVSVTLGAQMLQATIVTG
jgi:hypothetical protein